MADEQLSSNILVHHISEVKLKCDAGYVSWCDIFLLKVELSRYSIQVLSCPASRNVAF